MPRLPSLVPFNRALLLATLFSGVATAACVDSGFQDLTIADASPPSSTADAGTQVGPADAGSEADAGGSAARDAGLFDAATDPGPPRSYQVSFVSIERTGPIARIPVEYRQSSPFEGDEVRMDPFNADVAGVEVFVQWARDPGLYVAGAPASEESRSLQLSDAPCAGCLGIALRTSQPEVAALVVLGLELEISLVDGRVALGPEGSFFGREFHVDPDGAQVILEVQGKLELRRDGLRPQARIGPPPRGGLLPFEAVEVEMSEPLEGRGGPRAAGATADRVAPTYPGRSQGKAFAFRLTPDSGWMRDPVVTFDETATDGMGLTVASVPLTVPRLATPPTAERIDYEGSGPVPTTFGTVVRPPAGTCRGTGCGAFRPIRDPFAGLWARLGASEPFSQVRFQHRALASDCGTQGPVVGVRLQIVEVGTSPGLEPEWLSGPLFPEATADAPPGFACDTGWREAIVEVPASTAVRQVDFVLEVLSIAALDPETLVYLVDEIGPVTR